MGGGFVDLAGKDAHIDRSTSDAGGATEPMTTATPEFADGGHISPTPSSAGSGKYSHKNLGTHDVFWTCSLDEFRAMNDTQWASFGTAFYTPPAGFNSATKHVVQLE